MMLKWDKSLLWEFILFYLFTWHQGSLGEGKVHTMLSPVNNKTECYTCFLLSSAIFPRSSTLGLHRIFYCLSYLEVGLFAKTIVSLLTLVFK